jgi:hypothetical protein
MHAVGLKSSRFLVTARRSTMPKAVSFLQSVQRLYISDLELAVEFGSYQDSVGKGCQLSSCGGCRIEL